MNYESALHELQQYRRTEKKKRLGTKTYLWAEDDTGRPWDTKQRGELESPVRIHITYSDVPVIVWTRGKDYTEFTGSTIGRKTLDRIHDHTNFQVWTRKGHAFICLRYGKHVLPFPYANKLNNTTGELVGNSDDWLNDVDAHKFYEVAHKVATALAHALVYGKVQHGWHHTNGVLGTDWAEDFGATSSPDLVFSALEQFESKKYNIELILGLFEKTLNMPRLREFVQSCMPDVYQKVWKGKKLLDVIARQLLGGQPCWYNDVVDRPADKYQDIKEHLLDGLLISARIKQ